MIKSFSQFITEEASAKPPTGNEIAAQIKWVQDYIMSPKYLERLKTEFPGKDDAFIKAERDARFRNVQDASSRVHIIRSIGSEPGVTSGLTVPKEAYGQYWDPNLSKWIDVAAAPNDPRFKKGHVYLEREYDPKHWRPEPGYETIPAHEIGHLIDDGGKRIPKATQDLIFKLTKPESFTPAKYTGGQPFLPSWRRAPGSPEFGYEQTPTEFINRMLPVRMLMDRAGISKAGTEKFTEQDWDELQKNSTILNNVHYRDIMNSLKGDAAQKKRSFIELFNTIASIPQSDLDSIAGKTA